jgi:hypothetical protein
METYATVQYGRIIFKQLRPLLNAFDKVWDWVDRANTNCLTPEQGENGEYNISILDHDSYETIQFDAHSGDAKQLEWQMEQLLAFVKTLEDIASFEAPIFVSYKNVNWENEVS